MYRTQSGGWNEIWNELTNTNNNSQINNQVCLNFNHPVRGLLYGSLLLHKNLFSIDEIKKNKNEQQINDLCYKFNKLCIPKTYDEYMANLSETDKNALDNINKIEQEWCQTLYKISEY
jgi:hypothetical protein